MKPDHEPSPDELQEEIAETRGQMKQTIDALQDRLSPKRAVDEVSGWIQEEMGPMIRTAGEAIRKHSIPAAITAGGLVWLTVALLRDDEEEQRALPMLPPPAPPLRPGEQAEVAPGVYRRRAAPGEVEAAASAVRASAEALNDSVQALGDDSRWDQVKAKVQAALEEAQSYISAGTEKARGYLSSAYDSTADAASSAYEYSSQKVSQAGRAVARSYDNSPLLYGLFAAAAGAAIAIALPSTRREDRLMGPYRDDLVDAAQQKADDLRQQAEDATLEGLRAATNTLRDATHSLLDSLRSAEAAVSESIGKAGDAVEQKTHELGDQARAEVRRATNIH